MAVGWIRLIEDEFELCKPDYNICSPNKRSRMFTRREYSLKAEKEHQQLEQLKVQLGDQLRVVSRTQQSFMTNHDNKQKAHNCKLPAVQQERIKPKTDRYISERIRYQNNLNTIIFQIKEKIGGHSDDLKLVTLRSNSRNTHTHQLSVKDRYNLKIRAVNLSPQKIKRQEMSRSSILAKQSHYSPKKPRKERRIQGDRFSFDPWNTIQQIETLNLHL